MKLIKWFIIVIVALIAVFLIFSTTQPNVLTLEEEVVIEAPPPQVYEELTTFQNWHHWSIWHRLDSNMQNEYSEKMGEVGSYNKWWSDHPMVGNGKQVVVEIEPNKRLKSEMTFEGWDDVSFSEFLLENKKGSTKVKWKYRGAKTPFYLNFMNTFMEPMLRENYKEGLENLKTYLESMPREVPNPHALEVMSVGNQPIASIQDTTTAEEISKKLAELYTEISIFIEMNDGMQAAGMPLAIYHQYSPEEVILEAAIPYNGEGKAQGRIQLGQLQAGQVIKGVHYGEYSASEEMHYAISDYAEAMDFEISNSPWEVYANDPTEVDSAAVETHIYYPINKTQ